MSLTSFDVFPVIKFVKTSTGSGAEETAMYSMEPGPALTMKGNMKKFTIEVSHAAPGQLATIAAELKIMSNGWTKFGPRIMINGDKLQAPSDKQQAASHKLDTIERYNKL